MTVSIAGGNAPDPRAEGVRNLGDVLAIEAQRPDPIGTIRNTYELLQRGASRDPSAPALSFFLRAEDYRRPYVWTHAQWLRRITQAANAFRRLGLERGDVVACILPNLPETHWVLWGGEAAGIVFTVNPLLEPRLMAELMRAAQPKVLVTLAPTPGADLWEKASAAAREVPSLHSILTVSPLRYLRQPLAPLPRGSSRLRTPARVGSAKVQALRALLDAASGDQVEFALPTLDDPASYFCTGGTTGLPKIAIRTHRTEVANAVEVAASFGFDVSGDGRALFCGLPLFHVNAQIGTGLMPWSAGAHVVLGTPQGYRAPGLLHRFWDIAAHYGVQSFSAVPTVYSTLLQHPPSGQDLGKLRYGVCGAAPMPVELFHRVRKEIGIRVIEGYGLTEGGCVSSLNPPGGEPRCGSVGIRLPWQDMRAVVLDAQGRFLRDAAVDEVGILAIHGPNLFKGYVNPAHDEGLWIERPDGQGRTLRWLNTGDLGRVDGDGYFWLTGRKKELIIRGGHNIDPKMIEEAMSVHPAVALAAAVGRPDRHAGEVPVVYVQLRPQASADPSELLAHAMERIAERAAWPKEVLVVTTLPTTAVGKIFKPQLVMEQMESAARDAAQKLGAELVWCKALQDPVKGHVLQWNVVGDPAPLQAELNSFAFANQWISEAPQGDGSVRH